ncbi:MAG: HPr family phosphocarrier protein [Planctomycetes bacterium]|nr:HPr family phosphocarrier protein [Planctomycetota bacterium]
MELKQTVTLTNAYGLHARPAALFVEMANKFQSDVLLIKDGQEVNGKSIMGIMMLGAECNTTLHIHTRGNDAEEALQSLIELVESGFGENGG